MGASRLRSVAEGTQPRELTTQERARRDWINEQRGIKDSDRPKPRMAGGIPGLVGLMTRGAIRHPQFDSGPRRDKATRDWIDQQRGVEIQKDDDKSALRSLFGMRTTADRQRRQDRNAWIDEQIRKQREEAEAQKISNANQPMTEEERRGFLNKEVESRKDIWDD
tara:strand:+ start:193 stop:687 length:495 start_codon:yes stop_codon:yes gene_type:complete